MSRTRATSIWRPVQISFGIARGRVPVLGWIDVTHQVKVFAASGDGRTANRVSRSGNRFLSTSDEMLCEGGMRLQCYWNVSYDIDVGGLTALFRRYGVDSNLSTRIKGTDNLFQLIDVLPTRGNGRSRDYDVTFRSARADPRPRNLSAWEWDYTSSDANIAYSGTMASIMTTWNARLPAAFSGSISADVSAEIGAEVSVEPFGVGVAASASVGSSRGASVDLDFRRRMDMSLMAEISVPTRM